MAFMGLPDASPEPWMFVAAVNTGDGTFAPGKVPALGFKPAQMFDRRDGDPLVVPTPLPTNRNPITNFVLTPTDDRRGVATFALFDPAVNLNDIARVSVSNAAVVDSDGLTNSEIPDCTVSGLSRYAPPSACWPIQDLAANARAVGVAAPSPNLPRAFFRVWSSESLPQKPRSKLPKNPPRLRRNRLLLRPNLPLLLPRRRIGCWACSPPLPAMPSTGIHCGGRGRRERVMAARTVPMMANRRFVLLRGAERWDASDGSSPFDALAEYAANPVPSTCMVIVASKIDGRRKLAVLARKQGFLVACEPLDSRSLPDWIVEQCVSRQDCRSSLGTP